MPLQSGSSRQVVQANIRELIKAGHSPSQSAAIAYKEAGIAKDSESARKYDDYGWLEVRGNPISKVGVFPYLGSQIGAPEPDRIYMVLRPEEELSHPDTIDSFKLLPFVNEHPNRLLGDGVNAEDKGIEGVIGEEVYYEAPYLRGNIKVFTNRMNESIDSGKIELSPGYQCTWDFTPGVFDGQRYEVIQRNIRGNHLALVEEGRSGPDVSVMDSAMTFAIDTKELVKMEEQEQGAAKGEMTLSEVTALLKEIVPHIQKLMKFHEELKPMEEKEHGVSLDEEAESYSEKEEETAMDETEPEKEKEVEKKGEGMDAAAFKKAVAAEVARQLAARPAAMDSAQIMAEISKKTDVVSRLSAHIGTFAHDSMSLKQVYEYGAEKLGLDKSHAEVAVETFLKVKPANVTGLALDSGEKSTASAFLAEQYK